MESSKNEYPLFLAANANCNSLHRTDRKTIIMITGVGGL